MKIHYYVIAFFRKKCFTAAVVHVDSTRTCKRNTRMLAVETRKCYLLHVDVHSFCGLSVDCLHIKHFRSLYP